MKLSSIHGVAVAAVSLAALAVAPTAVALPNIGVSLDNRASLEAIAAASGRPAECAPVQGVKKRNRKPSVWERAKSPQLVEYCDLVAKAHLSIESDPAKAIELTDKAIAVWPDMPGARVARGRALVEQGKFADALEELERADAKDRRALEEPRAMRARARALVKTGRIPEGAGFYRTLVPRTTLMPDALRARVLLEAAFAVMADAAASKAGSLSLDEANAFVDEAREVAGSALHGDIMLTEVLVHDRAGEPEKARTSLEEAALLVASAPDATSYVADPSDALAVRAVALEIVDPSQASAAWDAFIQKTSVGAFKDAATARKANLGAPKKSKKERRGEGQP
ncbi:MAG: tetratricopeptide repeat protein [Polyangiaceae bacterium]